MSDCWSDDLAGLATDQGVYGRDCLMVGMMDGDVTDWWDECWAGGLTGLMAGLRVGLMRGKVAMVRVMTGSMGG